MKWLKIIGGVVLAILLGMVGMNAAQRERRAKGKDEKEADRLNKQTADQLEAAKKFADEAVAKKKVAAEVKKQLEKDREDKDEDIDSIADKFNKRKLRKQPKD